MKPKHLVMAIALCAAVASFPASACFAESSGEPDNGEQKTILSVEEAMSEGLEHNPGLRVLEADRDAALGERRAASAFKNPDLFALPGVRHSEATDGARNSFYTELGFEQLLEFPGKRALRVAAADKNVEIRRLAIEAFRLQVQLAIRREFFALLAAEKIKTLREQGVDAIHRFAQSAQKRAESGYSSDFDVLKARTELVAAEKTLADAWGRVKSLTILLNTLMGRPANTPLEASGDLETIRIGASVADPMGRAMEENFALKAQEVQAQRAGVLLKAARRERYPDLTVGPAVEYEKDDQLYKFGVTFPIPLLNRHEGEIQAASAEQRKAVEELGKVRQEILAAVIAAVEAQQVARGQLELYTPRFLKEVAGLADRAEKGYAENRLSLLLYLDARRSYFDTMADYYETLSRVAETEAQLEAAIGGAQTTDESLTPKE